MRSCPLAHSCFTIVGAHLESGLNCGDVRASVLAVHLWRRVPYTSDVAIGPITVLEVPILAAGRKHTVNLRRVEAGWCRWAVERAVW